MVSPLRGNAFYALGLLAMINVFNFVDRQVITILFEPIKHELHLSDTALGLLGGMGFAIFYALMSIPLGWVADVWSRRKLISLGVAAWSAMTAACGFAQSFGQLFGARIGVGVGEASFGPAALSLISDLFPPHRRSTAQAVFAAGVPIGAGVGLIVGGLVAAQYGWRAAFYLLGAPGLVLALLAWGLREPARGSAEGFGPIEAGRDTARLVEVLFKTRTLRYHYFGVALIVFAIAGFSIWAPSFLLRHHGLTIRQAGAFSGLMFATAGLVGVMLGGTLADWMARRRVDGRMRLVLYGAVAAAPLTVGTLYIESFPAFAACFWANSAISSMWFSPASSTVHDVVEPRHRGIAMAVYFAFINILGFAMGPLAVGLLSDASHDLRIGMLLCPAAGILGAIILRMGARHLEGDRALALARAGEVLKGSAAPLASPPSRTS
jgi:MFS family permease